MDAVTTKQAKKDGGQWRKIVKIEKIFALSFKTITIKVSCSFIIHMNVNELKPKIHLIKI